MEKDPFPIREVATIAVINSVNSASYLMTYPFVSFMILEFYPHLLETEIGYYSGVLEGTFHVGSIIGAIFWGWFADKYGRKPALTLGLFGTILATIGFGLSPNFGTAILTRLLWGLLNGNVGVAKTALSEVCSDQHTAKAFSYIGLSNGVGRIFGPALGGLLSEPAKKYSWGKIQLFITFPFLLPCLVAAGITALTALMAHFFLKETLPQKAVFVNNSAKDEEEKKADNNEDDNNNEEKENEEEVEEEEDEETKHLNLKSKVTMNVDDDESIAEVIDSTHVTIDSNAKAEEDIKEDEEDALLNSDDSKMKKKIPSLTTTKDSKSPVNTLTTAKSNLTKTNDDETPFHSMLRLSRDEAIFSCIVLYMGLGFIGLVSAELYPIYVINDAPHGGFGLDSSAIGLIAMSGGPWMVVYQGFLYHRLTKYFGLRRFSIISLILFSLCLFTTPMQSFSLQFSKDVQWAVLYIHYGITTVVRVSCFTSSFVFTANSAFPEDRGKVNGLGQATVSLARAIGPPLGTAIFAWSVSDVNRPFPFNYYFSWMICGILVLILLIKTRNLPAWIENKRVVTT